MTVINTNTASISAQYNLNKMQKSMDEAMQALSSGKRINSAADDAAGLSIATRMESQIRGLNQAIRNANDGISLVDTAEGAMDEITNMLQRMRELAVQAANDTNDDINRASLNDEIGQLQQEIDRVVNTTEFNGKMLLDGTGDFSLQIGSAAGQTLGFTIGAMGTASLGSANGASGSATVRSAEFQGVAAEVTEARIAFSGDDSYGFKLTTNITGDPADNVDLTVSGDVQNNSAAAIAASINSAAKTASVDEYVTATASGNTVTVKNSFGSVVTLSAYTSTGNSTATYTTINGGDGSDASVVLGSTAANTGKVFNVNKGDAYVEAKDATDGVAAVWSKDFTDAVDLSKVAKDVEVDFGSYSVTIAADDAKTLGDLAAAINAKTTDWNFSADGTTLTATAAAVGAFTGAPGITLTEGSDTAVFDLTMTEDTAGADPTAAEAAKGGTHLYLDILSADDYSFKIGAKDIEFSYTGTSASRDSIASSIGATLGGDFTVTHEGGQIHIMDKTGAAIALDTFASTGNGRIVASTTVADAGDQGTSEMLDDTSFANTASTVAAGNAKSTVVNLEFTKEDVYSFRISDGNRTAVVDATKADDGTTAGDLDEMLAAVNYGLERAGMDDAITAAIVGEGIVLTQAAGRVIEVSEFSSDAAGAMLIEKSSDDTVGVSRFLDNGSGTAASVSQVDVASAGSAASAIDIIDEALDDVNSQRSKLGAIANRLDHTISNLGNIVVNTEAAQSGIQDADFAAETSSLTKAQILTQAATAMLAQANASKQSVLSLLQG